MLHNTNATGVSMVEPYGVRQPHALGRSSGPPLPPLVLSASCQRGAALPTCMPLSALLSRAVADVAARQPAKVGLPLSPLQASRLVAISPYHVRSSPFYPLHTTRGGIAVFRCHPAYMLVNFRRHTATIEPSCGKANLYIALSAPLLFSMSIFQQHRQQSAVPHRPTNIVN